MSKAKANQAKADVARSEAQRDLSDAEKECVAELTELAPMVLNTPISEMADIMLEQLVNILCDEDHPRSRALWKKHIISLLWDIDPLDTAERMLALQNIIIYCASLDRWKQACSRESTEKSRSMALNEVSQMLKLQMRVIEQFDRHRARKAKLTRIDRVRMRDGDHLIVRDKDLPEFYGSESIDRLPGQLDPRMILNRRAGKPQGDSETPGDST